MFGAGRPGLYQSLMSPFPDIPLIASGGVPQGSAAAFIIGGAAALGIGRDLTNPEAVQRRQWGWISELAGRFLKTVRDARTEKVAGVQ